MIKCPICKCDLWKINLDKHLEKVHKIKDVFRKKADVGKIEVVRTYYVCNLCSKKIIKSNVVSHLNKIHDLWLESTNDRAHEFYFKESKQVVLRKNTKRTHSKKTILMEIKKSLDLMLGQDIKNQITCSLCDKKMTMKAFRAHCRNQHSVSINSGMPLQMNKNKKFDSKLGAELYQSDKKGSMDIFDKPKSILSGSFENGKKN